MEYEFAPLEGITGPEFRRIHHRFFPGVDRYFTPFLSPNQNHVFPLRELRQVLPEENEGITVVPQLLTKNADDFLWAAGELAAMGYREVNLNLGCPSGTVTAKGKGSGFLADLAGLERFFDQVFAKSPLAISVKTRLGMTSEEEFGPLLSLFCRYPIARLTIHPRVREDHYRHPVRLEAFDRFLPQCTLPVCFNGGIATVDQCRALQARWPQVEAFMIGQGLLADPALVRRLKGGPLADLETLRAFHDALYSGYCLRFQSAKNAAYHMKELWRYLHCLFDGFEPFARPLRKAAGGPEYEAVVASIFQSCPLRTDAQPDW